MLPEPHAKRNRNFEASGSALPPECASVQAQLFDYLDGDLPAAESEQVRAHLDACAVCQRELALCRESEQALASALQAVPPAGDLRAQFYARLAASERTIPLWKRWRRRQVAVPALATVLLAAVLVHAAFVAPRQPGTVPGMPPGLSGQSRGSIARNRSSPSVKTPQGTGTLKSEPAQLAQVDKQATPVLALPTLAPSYRPHPPLHRTRAPLVRLELKDARPKSVQPPLQMASALGVAPSRSDMPTLNKTAPPLNTLPDSADTRAFYWRQEAQLSESLASSAPGTSVLRMRRDNFGESEKADMFALSASASRPASAPAAEVVSLHVVDEERGFTATTKLAAVGDAQDGDEVITIETKSVPAPNGTKQ